MHETEKQKTKYVDIKPFTRASLLAKFSARNMSKEDPTSEGLAGLLGSENPDDPLRGSLIFSRVAN